MALVTAKSYAASLAERYLGAETTDILEEDIERVREMFNGQRHRAQYVRCSMTESEKKAYLKYIFPSSVSAANGLLQNCPKFLELARQKRQSGHPLRVASLGCGPGSEVAALLWCLSSRLISIKVNLLLLDLQDWSEMVTFTLAEMWEKTNLPAVFTCFRAVNLLEQTFVDNLPHEKALTECDVFLFSKIACEIEAQKQSLNFYAALCAVAKPASLIVAIDIGFEKYVSPPLAALESIALKHSFSVAQSSRCEHEDGTVTDRNEDIAKAAEVKPFAYRVLEKSLTLSNNKRDQPQLAPAWKRKAAQDLADKCKNSENHFMPKFG